MHYVYYVTWVPRPYILGTDLGKFNLEPITWGKKMTAFRKINTLALVSMLASLPAFGQEDEFSYLGTEDSEALSVDQMDIDGVYRRQRSRAERLENNRRKLERENENLVRQKIEDARIREERKMTNKLRKMFKKSSLSNDQDNYGPVKKSNTVTKQIVYAPAKKVNEPAKFKIIPTIGAMVVDSENVSYDASSQFGISFESMINHQFSIGMGVSMGKVDIQDINTGFFNPWFSSGLFNAREINYKRTTIDLTGKFFLLPDNNVNPYFGAGIGYSRDRLKYDGNQNLNNGFGGGFGFNGNGLGETYRRNYASWSLTAGTEVKFSRNFGLNLELRHSRGFGSDDNANGQFNFPTQDQLNLNRLGNELSGASFTSLNLGIIGSF